MVKVALVADAKPGLEAVNVYPEPGWVMERFEKTAPAALVVEVKLPFSAVLPEFPFSANVTATAEVSIGFPEASSATTMIDGAIE